MDRQVYIMRVASMQQTINFLEQEAVNRIIFSPEINKKIKERKEELDKFIRDNSSCETQIISVIEPKPEMKKLVYKNKKYLNP